MEIECELLRESNFSEFSSTLPNVVQLKVSFAVV